MSRAEAEAVAIDALGFIAADPVRLGRFLALTGLDGTAIRAAAADPNFLPAVLRFVAGHEPDLLAFAATSALQPAAIRSAALALGAMDAE